ncbi:zinc-finger domain-containing protein [Heyndrickxia sporothermodurans]
MEREKIIEEMNELLTTYCESCLVKSTLRKDYNKAYAHQFCIQTCTVGEKLKLVGKKLVANK